MIINPLRPVQKRINKLMIKRKVKWKASRSWMYKYIRNTTNTESLGCANTQRMQRRINQCQIVRYLVSAKATNSIVWYKSRGKNKK